MEIREALKIYLAQKGIKQSFISERTGIPESAISRMLNGNIRLTADAFAKICIAVEITMDEVVRFRDAEAEFI